MRQFYSDYVRHCMRFYARHICPKFKSSVDKNNWISCESALKGFTDNEQELLINIYRKGDTIPDNVYQAAKANGMKQESVWKLVNDLERMVAKRRGLL